ncbi:2-amino-4-hydroxy-6-hydroxymethyldihydropteridinediphosphokinase [soil metagenome]
MWGEWPSASIDESGTPLKHCLIGIGSNVGDRRAFCRRAVAELHGARGVEVTGVSDLYETSPVGGPPQRSYVNAVATVETDLGARPLLEVVQGIERRLGRRAGDMRWGPRVIDIDILTYGDEKIGEPDLEVPHPRMTERRFVLVPLLALAPGATDPWGRAYADFLGQATGDVRLLERWDDPSATG